MYTVEEAYIEGKKYIIPKRDEEWKKICGEILESKVGYAMMRDILSVMRLLSEGNLSYEEIAKRIGSNHSGASWSFLENVVAKFTPSGYDFAMDRSKEFMSNERREYLEKVNLENKPRR